MPTAEQQQTKKALKPRFKVDPAASPMPETKQPERLPPRATSNRNGGRDHLGILGEIKSVHPGEIIGIRRMTLVALARRKIQQFGPYKSLALLFVPLLIVEPLKIAGWLLQVSGIGSQAHV